VNYLRKFFGFPVHAMFLALVSSAFLYNGSLSAQPDWVWAKDIHTSSDEYGNAVAVDPVTGNVVIAGVYKNSLSAYYGSSFTGATKGGFVAKYDPAGNVIWGFKIGNNHNNSCNGLAIDSLGNIYVAGVFELTTDFTGTSGTSVTLTATGAKDAFLAKYNSAGQLVWAKKGGGNSTDEASSVALNSNKVFITGYYTNSASFGSLNTVNNNSSADVFIVAYDLNGNPQWLADAGTSQPSFGHDIAADNSGVYIIGEFKGTPFTVYNSSGALAASFNNTTSSKTDAFVLSFSTSGSYNWGGLITSSEDDNGNSISVSGNMLYVTGSFKQNTNFPFYSGNPVAYGGHRDMFLSKMAKSTGVTQWVKTGSSSDVGEGLSITNDLSGNVYVAGYYKSSILFSGGSTAVTGGGNAEDLFVVSYTSSGTYQWAREAGSDGKDEPYGIACSSTGEIYVTGEYKKDPLFGITTLYDDAGTNCFLAKIYCPDIINNTISFSQTTICSGSTASISGAAAASSALTVYYDWQQSVNATSWIPAAGTNNQQNYSSGSITGTMYYRRRAYTLGSCSSSSFSNTITINVDQPPSIAAAGADRQVCITSLPLTLNGNVPSTGTGVWTIASGAGTIVSPSSASTQITSLSAGNNVLKWTITNGVCPSSVDSMIIRVDALPTISNAGNDQHVCITSPSVTLNANMPSIGAGSWSIISGFGNISSSSSPTAIVNSLSNSIINTFQWTITNGVCPASVSTVDVIVDQLPTNAVAGSNQTICSSASSVNLSANTPVTGTGSWTVYSGSGTFSSGSSPLSAVSNFSVGPNVYLWNITSGACPASSASVTITVDAEPTVSNAGVDKRVCINADSTNMEANVPYFGTGVWTNISGSGNLSSFTDPHATISGLSLGDNVFEWKISNGICPSSVSTVTISLDQLPDTALAGPDVVTDVPAVLLEANTPAVGTGQWIWMNGNGIIDSNTSAIANVSAFPVGNNILVWEIKNGACPPSRDEVHILMKPIEISNGFSPNGDGVNDSYRIPALEYYPNVKFNVFNKWGNVVYKSEEYKNEWDGTNTVKEKLADDTYYFTMEILPGMEYNGFIIIKTK
jgi:gliding motility-associated-like protein